MSQKRPIAVAAYTQSVSRTYIKARFGLANHSTYHDSPSKPSQPQIVAIEGHATFQMNVQSKMRIRSCVANGHQDNDSGDVMMEDVEGLEAPASSPEEDIVTSSEHPQYRKV